MTAPTITQRETYAFVLWKAGERRTQLPRFRYQTYDAAEADAQAEAGKRPGTTIYILKEISRVRCGDQVSAGSPRCDSGGAPKAPDANEGQLAPSDVNGVPAPGRAVLPPEHSAPNPANPALPTRRS